MAKAVAIYMGGIHRASDILLTGGKGLEQMALSEDGRVWQRYQIVSLSSGIHWTRWVPSSRTADPADPPAHIDAFDRIDPWHHLHPHLTDTEGRYRIRLPE